MPLTAFSIDLLSENLLLLVSMLVFAGVMVAKAGSRLGAPSMLLFLLLGVLVGPDVLGLYFEDLHLAESIGNFAMSVIMFTAGMETSLAATKSVMKQGILLSTLGVLLTVVITGSLISLYGVSLLGCCLLAAIISSTDSASVFSVLRDRKLHLQEKIGPILELESGANDPIAFTHTVVLVNAFIMAQNPANGTWAIIGSSLLMLVIQLSVGIAVGLLVGFAAKLILDRIHFPNFALLSILVLSIGFFASGAAQFLQGNGMLATYIAAIIIGNKVNLDYRKDMNKFFDCLAWMMQLVMFMLLGLLAHPSQMGSVILPAIAMCLVMVFMTRPLSVFLCLLPFKGMSFRAKAFISWVGSKGSGPILCALYAMVNGMPNSSERFNFVFLFTVFSLMLQGGTLGWMAKKLNVGYEEDPVPETFGMDVPEEMGMMRDHVVTEEDLEMGATLRELHLPHGIRVMMVRRNGRFLVPHGSMALEKGDHLIIIIGESDD